MKSRFSWNDAGQQFKPLSEMLKNHFIKPMEEKLETAEKYLRKESKESRKQRSPVSAEISIMALIERKFGSLTNAEQRRIVRWLMEKYDPYKAETVEVPEN